MTSREPILIGPFSGGMNTFDDPAALKNNEVVLARNFDMGTDGTLVARNPFIDSGATWSSSPASGSWPRIIGRYITPSGTFHIISDGVSKTYYYNESVVNQIVIITSTFAATDAIQFDGKMWLVAPPGSANPGGSWVPPATTGSGTFSADATMPKGRSIAIYRSRLFIAVGANFTDGGTRVYYSKVVGQSGFWSSPGFFEVNGGDGQPVIKIVPYLDSLLVFKSGSIWNYQFGTDPATATIMVAVGDAGLDGSMALTLYENTMFFLYNRVAYEYANGRAIRVSDTVIFDSATWDGRDQYTVSSWGERIMFSFYEKVYVFSTTTHAWTVWDTDHGNLCAFSTQAQWVGGDGNPPTGNVAYAYTLARRLNSSTGSVAWKWLSISESVFTGADSKTETLHCELVTKVLDFLAPGDFKVMFWWGLDATAKEKITATVTPYPGGVGTVSTVAATATVTRRFLKFFKKLRFRQVQFRIQIDTQSSAINYGDLALPRIFSLSAYVAKKEAVSKQLT